MKMQPTLTIQQDDKVIIVSESSDQVKQLIAYYDEWKQKEADLSGELLMVKSALRDLQTVIVNQLTLDNKPTESAQEEDKPSDE